MKEVSIIGVDLAKQVFQLYGATADGEVVFRKKLSRKQFVVFMEAHPRCRVAMEACATAHHWARMLTGFGHEVRLIAPKFVKPYVKTQKNDMADAEVIVEAATRPTMRFVEIKTIEQQGLGMVFRSRDLLVGQRTQTINALRGHLTEFGEVVPQGAWNARRLVELVDAEDGGLPGAARSTLRVLADGLRHLDEKIAELDAEIAHRAREDEVARRLMTIPGIGPLIATALATLAPPPEHFRQARDFAAWLGLTPRQHSTGGKQRLGATTKMGERSLRRLLILGANSVVIKRCTNPMAQQGTWLGGLLARKPGMMVRVALANKLARIVWALMARGGVYKAPVAAA